MTNEHRTGFTIVELLIVIVVIGILAAITIVAYNGVQAKARAAKVQSDIAALQSAIAAARINESKALFNITGNSYTASYCSGAASGTDLTDRSIAAVNNCWTAYALTLDRISVASGINVRNLTDPWGRPYRIDENENENNDGRCTRDSLSVYKNPHVSAGFSDEQLMPNSLINCQNGVPIS